MKIDDVIKQLEMIKKVRGNIDVVLSPHQYINARKLLPISLLPFVVSTGHNSFQYLVVVKPDKMNGG